MTGGENFGALHVLIVDDDRIFLDLLEALLMSVGVSRITRAATGREGLEKLRSSPRVVDVILCDQNMREGTGLHLLWAVRTGQIKTVRPDACFLLVSASADRETVALAARLDVSGFLVKPITPDKLRTAITQGRRRAIKIDIGRYKQVQLPAPQS